MKILYHHRIASKDGQFTHIEEMVEAMRGLGHEVLVVGPRVLDADKGSGGSAGWVGRLKALMPAWMYEVAEMAYALVVYRRLTRAIRAFGPDFIYERYALFQPAGVWASRRLKIPLLLEVNSPYATQRRAHDGLKLHRIASWVEGYTIRSATKVFPVSHVLGEILQRLGVKAERICVVPNAINPRNFESLPTPDEAKARHGLEGRTVVGFIGFVRAWDGLDKIVDWLAKRPPADPVTLMIVGDGPARASLERQARDLGIPHKLHFTGVVHRTEVPSASMAFDVALQSNVLPYISPLCLFEYMAMGKAILAPDQPNHHELLRDGLDAQLFEVGNDEALLRGLDRLVGDRELREQLGSEARATLMRRGFTWSANAQRVIHAARTGVDPTVGNPAVQQVG